MFIIKLTYKVPLEEINQYIQAHREFLDYHYKQGLLLASGPLKPRTGGIVIANTTDKIALEKILKQDPLLLADLASYELIEFTPIKHCDELKERINKTEGRLC